MCDAVGQGRPRLLRRHQAVHLVGEAEHHLELDELRRLSGLEQHQEPPVGGDITARIEERVAAKLVTEELLWTPKAQRGGTATIASLPDR